MRLDQQIAKYYYTAAEARKVLGLDEQAFQYWIRKGLVHKTILPGKSQGVYSKRDINAFARKIEATILAEQEEGIEFRKALPDDIEQEAELAQLVFGEKARAIEGRRAFLEKNPDVDYHVYDRDKLVAYISIVPLKHEIIENFINGKIKNLYEIDPDNIEQFTSEKPLECVLVDMVTSPTVLPVQRVAYGSKLLNGLARALVEMGMKGVQITKLYATSRTPSGIRILKGAGFKQVFDHGAGRLSFELDVMNSDEKILKEYQETFREWKAEHEHTPTSKSGKNKKVAHPPVHASKPPGEPAYTSSNDSQIDSQHKRQSPTKPTNDDNEKKADCRPEAQRRQGPGDKGGAK